MGGKQSWKDPIVLVAVVTALGSMAVTVMQGHYANNDLKDSFKATAEAVNNLNLKLGEVEGKVDAHIAWHQNRAPASVAPVPAPTPAPMKDVLRLDTIEVQGKIQKPLASMILPDGGEDADMSFMSTLAENAGVAAPLAKIAEPPPTKQLSTDLDTALKQVRAK